MGIRIIWLGGLARHRMALLGEDWVSINRKGIWF